MSDERETDEELLDRHKHVVELLAKAHRQKDRMKPGTGAKDRKSRWCGSLYFTLLQIESEIRDRKLEVPV